MVNKTNPLARRDTLLSDTFEWEIDSVRYASGFPGVWGAWIELSAYTGQWTCEAIIFDSDYSDGRILRQIKVGCRNEADGKRKVERWLKLNL